MDAVGDYTIQRQLGRGIFGEVYLAEHCFIKRSFALKMLPEELNDDPEFIRRFETQIGLTASLDHSNILKIHNVSCQNGRYFVVTDAVLDDSQEGTEFDTFLEKYGPSLSEDEIEELLLQIASALDYAHAKGVIHGSLKLTNIFVRKTERGWHPLLADFGLTRLIGEGFALRRIAEEISTAFCQRRIEEKETKRGIRNFMQALGFLAPEQKQGDRFTQGEEVDAYALGVLAYYMLVRKLPEGLFHSIASLLPAYRKAWDRWIALCLDPNPQIRPTALYRSLIEMGYREREEEPCQEMVANVHQLAFEFSTKESEASTLEEITLKPILNPKEITRPEYESDPGAVFQRETQVSPYIPKMVEIQEIEPLLTPMAIIPGGTYVRGSFEGSRDEMPRHEVILASFAMDIHPVTNEQFVRFLQVMGGEKDHQNNDIIRLRDARIKRSTGKLIIESGYSKHPVVGVTWYGALSYAKWIGKRLPLEAEWEIAALGGNPNSLYPTGMDIEKHQANFFSSDTTPVMSYAPNGSGFHDMPGNVYEWCQDWYAYNYYETSAIEPHQPLGPQQGVYRVLRGGCWKSLKEDMRCSHRHRNNPGAVNSTYGFRCVAPVASS